MKQFDIAQSFIERCEWALRGGEIAAASEQTLQTLGFRYFACRSHVDPLRTPRRAVMLHNYRQEWVQCFEMHRQRRSVFVDGIGWDVRLQAIWKSTIPEAWFA